MALVAGLACAIAMAGQTSGQALDWSRLPAIPDRVGFAGPIAGVSDGMLVVAGGANFPERPPWQGGAKVWYDTVRTLDSPSGTWRELGKLPRQLGYAVSLTTPRGIACLGGSDSQRHYRDCFLLRIERGAVVTEPLADLPRGCANACGALVGNTIYLAGGLATPGDTAALDTFWSLDVADRKARWQSHPSWPGPARMLAVAGAHEGAFYLFSGASLTADAGGRAKRTWLRDAYRYTPEAGWKRIADLPRVAVAAPSPAPEIISGRLALFGGDDGSQLDVAPEAHRGFAKTALIYDTRTNTWTEIPLRFSLVATPAVRWNERIVVAGGESRPGVRSTEVWQGGPAAQ